MKELKRYKVKIVLKYSFDLDGMLIWHSKCKVTQQGTQHILADLLNKI